jgi:hypothetical protein
MAIDVATIFYAINQLEKDFLGINRYWNTYNVDQKVVFELYQQYKNVLGSLKNLKAKASIDWEVLNKYLTDNGFDKMFSGPLEGIGAVSILDMLVEWLKRAEICNIYGNDGQFHVGFEIPVNGRDAYIINGNNVVRLKTKSGDSLWLTMPEKAPNYLMSLVRIAFTTMSQEHMSDHLVTTVRVPEIVFDIKPDISFLVCSDTHDANGQYWFISQAYQQFKLKMNRKGARVQVATGLAMRKGGAMADEPQPLVFNRPFVGWFTQTAAPLLPIAIFYADYNSWQGTESLR